MTTTSSASAEISASATDVTRVLLDFDKYPTWAGFESVSILQANTDRSDFEVQFELTTSGVSDKLIIQISQPSLGVIVWSLRESTLLSKLDGKFDIIELDSNRCKVTYELDVRFKNAMMNLMKRSLEGQMIEKLLNRLADQAAKA